VEEASLSRLDVIKIDTEGKELDILKGASNTLMRYKPDLLLAAYHYSQEHIQLASYLKTLGYTVSQYHVPLFLSRSMEIYLHACA
jgi:hypothetical protein